MTLLALLACVSLVAAAFSPRSDANVFSEQSYTSSNVIIRDVCIIGGGASGTYAAIRLRDMGKSVVVIEREEELGGHTRSYRVPGTNLTIDYGVQGFSDIDVVRNFFNRFDVPLSNVTMSWGDIEWVDFRTGKYLPDFVQPEPDLQGYKAQLEKYPYLMWTMDLPSPVPEDLLLPFGEFVEKYSLHETVPRLSREAQGVSDLLRLPTVYIFQAVGLQYIRDVETHAVVTSRRNNHEIYEKAREELGADALLSSHVVAAQRLPGPMGVKVIVMTPKGTRLIKAKRLLVTIPPKLNNMFPFNLDEIETGLFSQFTGRAWYVALVAVTNFPRAVIMNANPLEAFNLPTLPGIVMILPTYVDDIYLVKYISVYPLPDALVKSQIRASIAQLGAYWAEGARITAVDIEILAYQAHVPFELTVPATAIKGGFYHKLNALQGHRSTWYTGAAFLSYHTSAVWNFTEALLPMITRDL